MRTRAIIAGMAVAGPVIFACGTSEDGPRYEDEARRYARAVCLAAEECGCVTDQHYSTREQCEARYAKIFLEALLPGDWVEEECLGKLERALHADPCFEETHEQCPVVRGELAAGEACAQKAVPAAWFFECAEDGGRCIHGVCREISPPPATQPGEACYAASALGCGFDLFCDTDGLCQQVVGEGEPCEPTSCGFGLYCRGYSAEAPGICTPFVPLGGECDPRDWGVCDDPYSSDPMSCDPETRTCVEGEWPFMCRSLAGPSSWR